MNKIETIYNTTKNLTILVAEDDVNLSLKLQNILKDLFGGVTITKNGVDALKEYSNYYESKGKFYDIVLSDIAMPSLSGVELSKKIIALNKKQIILILSANKDSKNIIELLNTGVTFFLEKPFEYNKLLDLFYIILPKLDIDNCRFIELSEGLIWNFDTMTLSYNNKQINLSLNEIKLMELLISSKDKICSNDDIYWAIYDMEDSELSADKIKSLVKRLRKKLPFDIIKSIYSQGYKLTLS